MIDLVETSSHPCPFCLSLLKGGMGNFFENLSLTSTAFISRKIQFSPIHLLEKHEISIFDALVFLENNNELKKASKRGLGIQLKQMLSIFSFGICPEMLKEDWLTIAGFRSNRFYRSEGHGHLHFTRTACKTPVEMKGFRKDFYENKRDPLSDYRNGLSNNLPKSDRIFMTKNSKKNSKRH